MALALATNHLAFWHRFWHYGTKGGENTVRKAAAIQSCHPAVFSAGFLL
jgi:hypothetical protein